MSWKEEFLKIWEKLMARRDSEFFREPVDWKGLGLYDYPKVISKPMDLKTLKRNVDNNIYKTPSSLADDVRLIYLNAMTYNDPNSKIFNHAKAQKEFFESLWNGIVRADEDQDRPPNFEQLTSFVEKCHRMTPDDLTQVLLHLESICPDCILKKPESNEVDVNTDLITGPAFNEIMKFLDGMIEMVVNYGRSGGPRTVS
jgi:hypothetical protein